MKHLLSEMFFQFCYWIIKDLVKIDFFEGMTYIKLENIGIFPLEFPPNFWLAQKPI